jgi:hypothetical protein
VLRAIVVDDGLAQRRCMILLGVSRFIRFVMRTTIVAHSAAFPRSTRHSLAHRLQRALRSLNPKLFSNFARVSTSNSQMLVEVASDALRRAKIEHSNGSTSHNNHITEFTTQFSQLSAFSPVQPDSSVLQSLPFCNSCSGRC